MRHGRSGQARRRCYTTGRSRSSRGACGRTAGPGSGRAGWRGGRSYHTRRRHSRCHTRRTGRRRRPGPAGRRVAGQPRPGAGPDRPRSGAERRRSLHLPPYVGWVRGRRPVRGRAGTSRLDRTRFGSLLRRRPNGGRGRDRRRIVPSTADRPALSDLKKNRDFFPLCQSGRRESDTPSHGAGWGRNSAGTGGLGDTDRGTRAGPEG
jgi:hypothetical protein